jgi:hypothetical protein
MKAPTLLSAFASNVFRAIGRARYPILTIAGTYAVSVLVGMVMVHAGSTFALGYRDRLVGQATQQDPAAQAADQGLALEAALRDSSGNLFLGAVPMTVSGFAIVFPYPMVARQGWVGGIVSVRDDHSSRLNDPRSAVYYLLTLLLQLIPYSLAVGAGVNAGIGLLRPPLYYQGENGLASSRKKHCGTWDGSMRS